MPRWFIVSEGVGQEFPQSRIEETIDELSNYYEATWSVPINDANMTDLVDSSWFGKIYFGDGGTVDIASGTLSEQFYGFSYGAIVDKKRITARCLDYVYEQAKAKTFSGEFINAPVNVLFGSIIAKFEAGLGTDTCLDGTVSVRFDKTYCWDAMKWLAKTTGQDLWSYDGQAFLGPKGSLIPGTINSSCIMNPVEWDWSKRVDGVIVRGVDVQGLRIYGEAGATGDTDKVAVFSDKKGCDKPTLDLLAEKKYNELSSYLPQGITLQVPIDVGASIFSGDWVTIDDSNRYLSGSYRVHKITKNKKYANLEVSAMRHTTEDDIEETDLYEDLGIYKLDPSMMTPWAINLGALLEHYHLNVDLGTLGQNSAPPGALSTAPDGVIFNGVWEQVGALTALRWAGNGSMVTTHGTYTNCRGFSIVAWISPTAYGTTTFSDSVICGAPATFDLGLHQDEGAIGFKFVAGGTYTGYLPTGSTGINARTHVAAVYDPTIGSALLYLNGTLNNSFAAGTANVTLPNPTYWGYLYSGYLGECSLFKRALSSQEVHELYFFPLNQLVKRGSAAGTVGVAVLESVEVNTDALVTETISEAPAAPVICSLYDSYATTNQDADHNLQAVHPSATASDSASFQTFAVGASPITVTAAKIYLKKYGSPANALIICALYAHTGAYGSTGVPTGTPLVESSGIISGTLTTSYVLYTFGFPPVTLAANTNYVLVVFIKVAQTINATNYVIVGRDNSSPSHGGNGGKYDASAWAAESPDMVFYLYT